MSFRDLHGILTVHSQARERVYAQTDPLPASSLSPEAAVSTSCSGLICAASLLQIFRFMAGAFLCLVHHVRLPSCKVEQRETGHCLSVPKWPPSHLLPWGTGPRCC